MKLCSPHLHYLSSHSLRLLVLPEDPGEDSGPLVHLGQCLNPDDTESSLQLCKPVATHGGKHLTPPGCVQTCLLLVYHLWSSWSMQARLSRPLSQMSKAAWKSLWTIICSAAVSNMLNSRVAEGASGGLQVGRRQRAAAMLLGQPLISHRQENRLLKTQLTASVSHPQTCLTPTRCPKTVASVYLPADVCLPSKSRFTSCFESLSQSEAAILSLIGAANRVASHFGTRHLFSELVL